MTKDVYINESMLKRMSMQLITKDGGVIETDIDMEHIKEMLKENKKEDHITRQFAIEYIQEECEDCPEYKEGECTSNSHCFEVKRMAINGLRTGHWKQISPAKIYECSECGQNVMTNDICCYKFCHGCGAAMEG